MILVIKLLICTAVALTITFGAIGIFHALSDDTTSMLNTVWHLNSNMSSNAFLFLAMLYAFMGLVTFDILSIAFFHFGLDQNREFDFHDGVEFTVGRRIPTKHKLVLYPFELLLFFVMLIALVNNVFHQA